MNYNVVFSGGREAFTNEAKKVTKDVVTKSEYFSHRIPSEVTQITKEVENPAIQSYLKSRAPQEVTTSNGSIPPEVLEAYKASKGIF